MFESEDMKQKFKNFLMARNVYVNFEKGVEDNHGKTLEQYLDEFWPGSYITGAFLWETSIDGTTVWSMLEMEWHDIVHGV